MLTKTNNAIIRGWGNWKLTRTWNGTERLTYIFKGEKRLHTIYADLVNSEEDVAFWMDFFKKRDFLNIDDIADLEKALNFILTREPVK